MSVLIDPTREKTPETMLFLGDSITDGGQYVSLLHSYFSLYLPDCGITFRNAGVSSETVSGLSEPDHPFPRPCVLSRSRRALEHFHPKWVVVSYGINDGIYYPFDEARFVAFQNGLRVLVEEIHQAGAKAIVLTTPVFYTGSFTGELLPSGAPKYSYENAWRGYNQVMKTYAEWVMEKLSEFADGVVDIFNPLMEDLTRCLEKDASYQYGDGIHPNLRGHFRIAEALLRGIFGISADCFEADMEADGFAYVNQMQQIDNLCHAADKEAVGHDNPYKAEVLPTEEREAAVLEGEKALAAYRAEHPALFCRQETWNRFSLRRSHFHGLEVTVVDPVDSACGKPWVWRTEFFGAFPSVDLEMLRRGYAVVHLAIPDRFGGAGALREMEAFQTWLVEEEQLSPKAVLFGFSRGGLYALHYAAQYPTRVAALYLDAPVVDVRSWPGGKGVGEGSSADWEKCLTEYGMTEETVGSYELLMRESIRAITEARLPLALVAGDADKVVPYTENGVLLEEAYCREGVPYLCILKPGVGHHPHSLEDPTPVADFLTKAI